MTSSFLHPVFSWTSNPDTLPHLLYSSHTSSSLLLRHASCVLISEPLSFVFPLPGTLLPQTAAPPSSRPMSFSLHSLIILIIFQPNARFILLHSDYTQRDIHIWFIACFSPTRVQDPCIWKIVSILFTAAFPRPTRMPGTCLTLNTILSDE